MEDPARMEWRHWANFDQNHVKDYFRDHMTSKLMDVMSERDAALADRETALAERKAAIAERDAALLQRDAAYADRNAAWIERDNALAALRMVRASSKDNAEAAAKAMQIISCPPPVMESNLLALPPIGRGSFDLSEAHGKLGKRKKSQASPKKQKLSTLDAHDFKASKSSKKKKKQQSQHDVVLKAEKQKLEAKPLIEYEISIPYCSCTGSGQQCYRWGSGGWQSACCTKFISSFPLPMNPAKHGSRIAGRKMSGGAFKKLLEKLVGEGVDVTAPIDLKNHWAKHGTNGYVTIR